MAESLINLFETTLSAGITASATTMTLTSTSGPGGALGTTGVWRFTIGRDTANPEIVTGTSRAGSVVTIVRAQGGTTASVWNSGTKVTLALTEEALLAIVEEYAMRSAEVVDMNNEYGFVGDDSTNNDSFWTNFKADLDNGNRPTTAELRPGIYRFSTSQNLCPANLDFLRIVGRGAQPLYNQTPDGDKQVIFKYMNASEGTAFDLDIGSNTLQSGIYFENINFVNGGHANNIALSLDRINNWRMIRCGFQGWGKCIFSESNIDNAHGKVIDCLVNVPAGKYAYYIEGGTHGVLGDDVNPTQGAGFSIDGGSISGTTGSIGIYGGMNADALTLEGDVKIDGTTGGGVLWYGRYLHVNGARFEGAGSPTIPAIDIKHDAGFANSGRGNIISSAFIVGRGAGNELSGRFDTGTFSNHASSGIYVENCASGWVDNGTYNIVSPQLWNAPSVRPPLPDGSTLADTINALQAGQHVTP